MVDGAKVPSCIMLKGTPLISPITSEKGDFAQSGKNSIAAEIIPGNRTKVGHPERGVSFSVQKSLCEVQE